VLEKLAEEAEHFFLLEAFQYPAVAGTAPRGPLEDLAVVLEKDSAE
jgi:hypothetical protein